MGPPFLVDHRRPSPLAPKLAQLLVALVSALFIAGACSSDHRVVGLAAGCAVNSDCTSPLVCAFQKCHQACTTTRDCSPGQRCIASDRPFHVCQLPELTNCSLNSDCPLGQVCAVDLTCRDQCATDRDCVNGQKCAGGACAETSELVNGVLPAANGGSDRDASTGAPCVYNSQCPPPLACVGRQCSYECLAAADCANGADCVNDRCVSGSGTLVGPDGGIVSTTGGRAVLEVPAGALRSTVAIVIVPLDAYPAGALGPVYDVLPTGLTFDVPAKLTLKYDLADIGMVPTSELRVGNAVGTRWQSLASTVDAATSSVTASLRHLSIYGVVQSRNEDGGVTTDASTGEGGKHDAGTTGPGVPEAGAGDSGVSDGGCGTGVTHVGDVCTRDCECARIPGMQGLCSIDAYAVGSESPTGQCVGQGEFASTATQGIAQFCDGGRGLAFGSQCVPACTIDATGAHGCPGKNACTYVAYTKSPTVQAWGTCFGGCTKDQDCLAGETCQLDLGYCRNAANVYTVSKPVGTACDPPDDNSVTCNCAGRSGFVIGDVCTQACALGTACPQGYSCDASIPLFEPSTGAPLFSDIGAAGVWGQCVKNCTADAECAFINARCELHAGMGTQKTCSTVIRSVSPDAGAADCTLADPNLEAAVRSTLQLPTGPITRTAALGLTNLLALHAGITSLQGIDCFANVTLLEFYGNSIVDLTPVANLKKLGILGVSYNLVADLKPIAGLTTLTELHVAGDPLTDISPILGIGALSILDVGADAAITNLPLVAQFGQLTELDIRSTQTSDLSFVRNLTGLTWLNAQSNRITDISPLAGLTALQTITLSSNQIASLSPLLQNAGIGSGDTLDISFNASSLCSTETTNIVALRARGVTVTTDCP